MCNISNRLCGRFFTEGWRAEAAGRTSSGERGPTLLALFLLLRPFMLALIEGDAKVLVQIPGLGYFSTVFKPEA